MKLQMLFAAGAAAVLSVAVSAQDGAKKNSVRSEPANEDALGFDEIIVTASARPANRLDSSISAARWMKR
ncbi:MAG: hypothetical protein P8Y58_00015 [Novosphingobium sp.]